MSDLDVSQKGLITNHCTLNQKFNKIFTEDDVNNRLITDKWLIGTFWMNLRSKKFSGSHLEYVNAEISSFKQGIKNIYIAYSLNNWE